MFQRLVAIPQEEYLSMSALRNVKNPLTQHFQSLQQQHNEADMEMDQYRRLLLQAETLDEMKDVKERLRQSLATNTPKPYQTRAKALYSSMETVLKFNERGEMLDESGNAIAHSHVEDLIQHAVRDRRRNITPVGWNSFLNLVMKHNVPKSVLNRSTLDEMSQSIANIKNEPLSSPLVERARPIPVKRSRLPVPKKSQNTKPEKRAASVSPMKLRTKRVKTNFLLNY